MTFGTPLAVLAGRIPWAQIEGALAPTFAWKNRQGKVVCGDDLFGTTLEIAGAGVSAAGRPRLPIRLMAALLYLKHAFNLSDEEVVLRWSEKEGKELRRKESGYAHAKQFKRLRRAVKRQRTILGVVLREVKRKLATASSESPATIAHLNTLLERAERIRTQQPKDKNKLYALHAPEVECIGKVQSQETL